MARGYAKRDFFTAENGRTQRLRRVFYYFERSPQGPMDEKSCIFLVPQIKHVIPNGVRELVFKTRSALPAETRKKFHAKNAKKIQARRESPIFLSLSQVTTNVIPGLTRYLLLYLYM